MANEDELKVINNASAASGRLTRREMVLKLLGGVGAGLAWSRVAAAHPIHKHLADAAAWTQADAKVAAAAWASEYLDSHQNEILILLAERMVPGSSQARVNRFIDLLLSVDTAENRKNFARSLAVFDRESLQRFGHPFKALTEAQQNKLLTVFSAGDSSRPDAPPEERSGQTHSTLHDHFENLKGWITGAYYSSEVGMRELGWTGDFVFDSFPGCQHPEGHR